MKSVSLKYEIYSSESKKNQILYSHQCSNACPKHSRTFSYGIKSILRPLTSERFIKHEEIYKITGQIFLVIPCLSMRFSSKTL